MQIKTFFNKKRFALGLISKVRVFGLWNWPIQLWLERSCTIKCVLSTMDNKKYDQ